VKNAIPIQTADKVRKSVGRGRSANQNLLGGETITRCIDRGALPISEGNANLSLASISLPLLRGIALDTRP
jgi:hypothetical protein